MKYKVKYENLRNGKDEELEHETKYGLKVYDKQGNEYDIALNELGELKIMANDGVLYVCPQMSNVITLKQK